MGAQSEDQIDAGDSWLPKNITKVAINVAPEAQYGKTREDSIARINELIAEGGES
jgi:hypothetical protein